MLLSIKTTSAIDPSFIFRLLLQYDMTLVKSVTSILVQPEFYLQVLEAAKKTAIDMKSNKLAIIPRICHS